MDKQLLSSTALKSSGIDDDPKTTKPVDNTTRKAWNTYIDWLEQKGMKGHPSLDHNELGFKMIDEFRKEHPDTPLSRDMVIPIQQEFSKYRDYALGQVDKGKAAFGPGANRDNFLRALSIVDGIPGQRTTSFRFPDEYLQTFDNGKLVSTQNLGFAVAK